VGVELEVVLRRGAGKQSTVNGARLRAAEQLRGEVATLVFTPDRLAVVKGAPAVRRAYLDRALGRLLPARAGLPPAYAGALAQRNAALRRVSLGLSSREALSPWTARVASLGVDLVDSRRETLALLEPGFAGRAAELGLQGAELEYAGDPPTSAGLEERLDRDLERGVTGLGPHLDDVLVRADGRDLRAYGSQGEQRLAVLALLLSEADVLSERREPPLLLLDDVLSELDGDRRATLLARLPLGAQTVVTATSDALAPAEPAQVVDVAPGKARSR
jgi:DNA replication and repair protein RecF